MESPLLENWLQVMKNELEEDLDKFTHHYNFNFIADKPIEKPYCRFKWTIIKNGSSCRTLRKCKTGVDGIMNKDSFKRLNSFTSLVN